MEVRERNPEASTMLQEPTAERSIERTDLVR